IPVFSRVGAAGAEAVETVKDKLSSAGDTNSDEGDGETETVEEDPWSDSPADEPSSTSPETDADTLVAEGEALSRDSKESEALKKFNQAIALDPSHAMAWFNRGVIHEMRGEVEEACKAFRICLDMKGDHGPAAANLAVLLDRRGDSNSAAAVAQQALSSFPGHPMLTKIAAGGAPAASVTQTAEEETGAADEIVEVSEPVVQPEPESAIQLDLDAIVEEAAGLVKSGNPEDSLELLRELLHAEAAEHPRAWRIAAASMAQMELVDNAIEAFTYTLDLDNEDAASWYNLGALHRKTGHEDSAVTCFDAALGLRPAYSKAASALADIHTANGDLGPAIDAWRSLLLVEPNHPGGVTFSEILVQIGEGEGEVLDSAKDIPTTLPEGPALATEALIHIPQDGVSSNIQLRARALTLTSAFPEAVKLWRSLIEDNRDDVGLWNGMMRTFIAAGDQTTAEKCRQKIASLTGETVSVDIANDALAPAEPEPEPAVTSEPEIAEPEQTTEAEPEQATEPAPEIEAEAADDGLMTTEEAPLSGDDPWGDAFEDSESEVSEESESA
ncbi:MAG TPA: tetratricopeptide repeat protein, partial [Candidatus Poseidoniales archaeon]|nr:tetratricopeptide repeat protein [Candidatus Poseidoniales archaeon]